MTKEEARTALGDRNNLLWGMSKKEQKYYSEAFDMAISALAADGEYIKKSELFDKTVRRNSIWNEVTNSEGKGLEEIVNDLPTYSFPNSENRGEWIPVSERLPKAYQKVLVTYEEIHWANEPTTYRVKLISFGGVVDFIAWQPLPEPYKAEGVSE